MAETATIPLDTAKVRLQIQSKIGEQKYKSMLQTAKTIAIEEGPRALYQGLLPGLQR